MSQIIKPATSGNLPPSVLQQFTTDNGIVIPSAFNININGGFTSDNNINGLQVIANPNLSNNMLVQLTNRYIGSVSTTDGVTQQNLLTFPYGSTPATIKFNFTIVAYNQTDSLSSSYDVSYQVRTTGAIGVAYGVADISFDEEGNMSNVQVQVNNNVGLNEMQVEVTGLAGKTIDWKLVGTYLITT